MATVDFHNHLIPGVDDGAQSIEETEEALEIFKADGVSVVITTPHVDGSTTTNREELAIRLRQLDDGFRTLQACAQRVGGVRVERGAELLLDTPDMDVSDARLRLAGTRFFLMEFPFMMVPPRSARAVERFTKAGYTPIIAHPERYRDLSSQLDLAMEWKESGACLQVNGGSLLGRYGAEARRGAFELLRRGWVDYLCSDYHARGPALVAQYRAVLEAAGGAEQAHTLMQTNPSRLLQGQAPLPVGSLQVKHTLWGRVTAIFR